MDVTFCGPHLGCVSNPLSELIDNARREKFIKKVVIINSVKKIYCNSVVAGPITKLSVFGTATSENPRFSVQMQNTKTC